MARFLSTFINPTPDPNNATGGLTLDALMKRRDELAQRQTQNAQPQVISSPWQGLAQIGQTISTGIQEGRAASQEAAGRDALTKAMTGFDPAAPDTAKLAEVAKYDPDLAQKLYNEAMRVRQEAATHARDRGEQLTDYDRTRKDKLTDTWDTRNFEVKNEERINTRESDEEAARNQREADEAAKIESDKRAYDEAKKAKETEDAKLGIVSGKAAEDLGLDPTKQWKRSADGTKLEVVPAEESYRPPTPEEIKLYKLDPTKPFRVNTKTGKPEEIGGNTLQLISPEVGAKLGLSDEFLKNYDAVVNSAKAGDLTGPIDVTQSSMGRGAGANAYGIIKQGTEGLIRLMTGAGMNEQEAKDRVSQYEPSYTDDSASLLGKLERLKNAIQAVREGATFGRNAPAAPAAGGGAAAPAAGGGGSAVDSALDQYK